MTESTFIEQFHMIDEHFSEIVFRHKLMEYVKDNIDERKGNRMDNRGFDETVVNNILMYCIKFYKKPSDLNSSFLFEKAYRRIIREKEKEAERNDCTSFIIIYSDELLESIRNSI